MSHLLETAARLDPQRGADLAGNDAALAPRIRRLNRVCAECGNAFQARSSAKYCSDKCRSLHPTGRRSATQAGPSPLTKHPLYRIWSSMIQRCCRPTRDSFPNYGGRGIEVCEDWRSSFWRFAADIESSIGPRPRDCTLDRIQNEGPYEPGNVRWATQREQLRNQRRNVLLTYEGRTMCVADWAAHMGITKSTLLGRLACGWSTQEALTTRPLPQGRRRPSLEVA